MPEDQKRDQRHGRKKSSIAVNLLGLYNYRSVADFVASMKVLKNLDDGSITITDTATAARIAVASTPLAADPDKLRAALYEGFVATATYKALETGMGVSSSFSPRRTICSIGIRWVTGKL